MSEQPDPVQREAEVPPVEDAPADDMGQGEAHPGEKKRLTVVGIGASAGGLPALQEFFDALSADTGMAFVVVTHMDPERESLLPEILRKHTDMPVQQVQEMRAIEADHVYVIPPNRRILITDTHLDTEEFEEPRGWRTPIDFFFRSLAAAHREAVAVILSGGGTDGSVGVKAIKEEGGVLMVQDPAEAEYDSMPRAAIATGVVDVVLPVRQLAEKLVEYHDNGVHVPDRPETLTDDEVSDLYRILTDVQRQTGHDFSQYKRSTLLRRVKRRMQLTGYHTLQAYLSYLRHEPGEGRLLFNDLLIGVTNFFRDRDAWVALAEQVIPHLFEGKEPEERVRVWSIGCATGEEAYSLAILLLEYAETLERPPAARPSPQVFASDLDEAALQKARDGVYPKAIEADVSAERLKRWFVKEGHYYRVRQELRDIVLFAGHSVLRDPPFSRLDLISCRNLLIYLNRELQENVFEIFHYALRPEAYLFLGNAESAEMVHALFHTVDKHHRLYQARPSHQEHPHLPNLPLALHGRDHRHLPRQEVQRRPGEPVYARTRARSETHLELLEEAAPPSVLVDEDYRILHLSERAGRYLHHPAGTVTDDLLKLVRPELELELRTTLFEAFRQGETVLGQPVYVQFDSGESLTHRVILAVRPQPATAAGNDDRAKLALVFFLEGAGLDTAPGAEATGEQEEVAGGARKHAAQLERQVQHLPQRLQSATEEHEATNEELRAANEELQSINEEYRSTAEELETSKEELQSVNEELQTVNAELKNKLEEVSRTHSDLENLMLATDVATLFLDRELRIQRYTPNTSGLFNIMPGDRGRPIGHLTHQLQYDSLRADAAEVLKTLVPVEREVQDEEGRWFLARLRPYRTEQHRIDGVVLTFVNISKLKEAEQAVRESEQRYRALATSTSDVIYRMSADWEEMERLAGRGFLADTKVTNPNWLEAYIPPEARPRVLAAIEEALRTKGVFELEHRVWRADGSVGWTASRAVPLFDAEGEITGWMGAASDITERKQTQELLEERVAERTEQVRELATQLTLAEHEERARISQILHDDLQQQLYSLQIHLLFLRENADAQELLEEIEAMEAALKTAAETARELSVDLSPPILEGEGLAEAITWLAGLVEERQGLQVTVEAEGSLVVTDVDRRVLLFRAVHELLFNVVKHAGVAEATVRLQVVDGPGQETMYRIDVEDNGAGFELGTLWERNRDGRGLRYIRERLDLIGGHLEVSSKPGEGTQVTIVAPPRGAAEEE